MLICVQVHVLICVQVHVLICVHVLVFICVHVHVLICVRVHVLICVQIHELICVQVHVAEGVLGDPGELLQQQLVPGRVHEGEDRALVQRNHPDTETR